MSSTRLEKIALLAAAYYLSPLKPVQIIYYGDNKTANRWFNERGRLTPVSYTHLTLPTILLV